MGGRRGAGWAPGALSWAPGALSWAPGESLGLVGLAPQLEEGTCVEVRHRLERRQLKASRARTGEHGWVWQLAQHARAHRRYKGA